MVPSVNRANIIQQKYYIKFFFLLPSSCYVSKTALGKETHSKIPRYNTDGHEKGRAAGSTMGTSFRFAPGPGENLMDNLMDGQAVHEVDHKVSPPCPP